MDTTGNAVSQSSSANDVYFAVMGPTGAGKSSFIHECSGLDVMIDSSLESGTKEVKDYTFTWNSRQVHLIDTPGFDDTHLTELQVLHDIAYWMSSSYIKCTELHGVIYLQSITQGKISGTGRRNILMFKKLCGQGFYPRVTLVGTFWDRAFGLEGEARERELTEKNHFWAEFVQKGARVERHSGTKESAMKIFDRTVDRVLGLRAATVLQIQKEMVVEQRRLHQTSAGQVVEAELIEQKESSTKELKKTRAEIQTLRDTNENEALQEAQEDEHALEAKIQQAERDRQTLRASLQDMQKQDSDEIHCLIAEVERIKAAYEEKINSLRRKRMQLDRLSLTSPERQPLKDELVEEAAQAAAMEREIAAKNRTISDRIERGFVRVKGWAERNPNAVEALLNGLGLSIKLVTLLLSARIAVGLFQERSQRRHERYMANVGAFESYYRSQPSRRHSSSSGPIVVEMNDKQEESILKRLES